ncbi:MAG TPA: hypothetical protein VHP14_07425 [Anaerolineales bacterium]|nr:hypothetical protein [Anaerolineales bacterium]
MHFENNLDDRHLSWDCIAPIIMKIRGKSISVKNEEYKKLNDGQKAIFSFHVYYDHAKADVESLIHWSEHYSQVHFFEQIKKGGEYFGNVEYIALLDKTERITSSGTMHEFGNIYSDFVRIGDEHKVWMGKAIRENREYFYSYK